MSRQIRVAGARRRLAEKPRAQVLMLVSAALVVLLGMAALAIDVGNLWTTRRKMQSAADAGAMAGVDAITVGESGTAVTTAAQDATAQNGFTNGSTTTTSTSTVSVAVHNPPTSGLYQGLDTAVQVVVSQTQPTYFMRVLGWTQVPVSTTATALSVGSGSCVFTLDGSSSVTGITVQGTTSLTSACGIYDNSDSSSALVVGGGGTITSPFVGVVGQTSVNGGGSTPPTTGIPAFGDPLAWVPEPTYNSSSCTNFNTTDLSNAGTVSPGVFCGGIKITGGTVNFSSGLYVMDGGGIDITGGTVSGSDVTFFLTGLNKNDGNPKSYGGVTINGNATVDLSAPCTTTAGGSVSGMLFFQDRSITNGAGSTINGGSGSYFNGALYFPTTALTYSGNTSSNMFTLLVSDTLTVDGTANIGNGTCLQGCCLDGPMIEDARLVE